MIGPPASPVTFSPPDTPTCAFEVLRLRSRRWPIISSIKSVVVEIGGGHGGDALTVAMHRDVVGDGEHFVDVMRHVEDGDATLLHQPDGGEQSLDVGAWQRGGWLVEYEQVRVFLPAVHRPGDGNGGLL